MLIENWKKREVVVVPIVPLIYKLIINVVDFDLLQPLRRRNQHKFLVGDSLRSNQ